MLRENLNKGYKHLEVALTFLAILLTDNIAFPPQIYSILNLISYGFIAFVTIKYRSRIAYCSAHSFHFIALILLAMCSFFWSSAPEVTADQIKAMLRTYFLGMFIASQYDIKGQLELLTKILLVISILSLLTSLLFPDVGISFTNSQLSWQGIYLHKNFFARTMAFSALAFVPLILRDRKPSIYSLSGFFLSVCLLILSKGKSALVVFLLLLVSWLFYGVIRQGYKLKMSFFSILFLILSLSATFIFVNSEFIVVDILGKDLEFNGRIPIWTGIISKGMERPWLGYGYAGFWSNPDVALEAVKSTWAADKLLSGGGFHSHSGFIDLFVQLGLVGTFLLIINFLVSLRSTISLLNISKTPEAFWSFQIILFIILMNINITQTILTNHLFWVLDISTSVSAVMQNKQLKRENAGYGSAYEASLRKLAVKGTD